MGLLRLLLATMVVFVHAGALPGFPTMGGNVAVQTFYIISGFYMALILNEKYVAQPNAYRLFLTNRVLRLLPTYYIVVSLTLLVAMLIAFTVGEPQLEFFRTLRDNEGRFATSTVAFIAFANLTLIGQDWLSFLTIDPVAGTLAFTTDFGHSGVNLNSLLLVQPAWTVSLELTFYVLAPFIVRRKIWVLLLIMAASVALRILSRQFLDLNGMAWSYRFLPFELVYFVAGTLSYRAYRFLKSKQLPYWLTALAMIVTLVYTLCFGVIHQTITMLGLPDGMSSALYRLLVISALPLVFLHTKQSRFDMMIGELSYPVYIIHYVVWEALSAYHIGGIYLNVWTVALSLGLAWGINQLIGERVEQVRQRVFASSSTSQPSLA